MSAECEKEVSQGRAKWRCLAGKAVPLHGAIFLGTSIQWGILDLLASSGNSL